MEKLFIPILDDDEVVETIYRPQKGKLFFYTLFGTTVMLALFCLGLAFAFFVPEEGQQPLDIIFVTIPVGIFVVGVTIVALFTNAHYKKTAYAVTNKRIVIRTGIIGVDFKSLDMAMIGAIDVNVSLSDKLLRKNTGSIRFGSTSSPINSENANRYSFKHVIAPYETCKEIKIKIDAYKQAVKNENK